MRRLITAAFLAGTLAVSPLASAANLRRVTVSWTPPTLNTDGTPCTDLAGFDVFYGPSPSALTHEVQVPGATQTSVVLTNLGAGPWYFAVTAYTTDGTQSAPSAVVEWKPPETLGQPVQLGSLFTFSLRKFT